VNPETARLKYNRGAIDPSAATNLGWTGASRTFSSVI